MSDPVSNAEVEDVLSSIRRLVSEEKRPLQARAQESRKVENEKLVLTPSLRIADDRSDQDATQSDHKEHESHTSDAEDIPDLKDILDDGSEVSFEHTEDDEIVAVESIDAPMPEFAEDYSSDHYGFDSEDDSDDGVVFDHEDADDHDDRSSDRDEDGDEAHQDLDKEPESDTSFDEEKGQEQHRGDDEGENLPFDLAEALADHDEAPELVGVSARAGKLSAKIEALETTIGDIDDRWEPDDPGSDDYAGTDGVGIAWEEDVQRDATGAPVQSVDDQKDTENAAEDAASDAQAETTNVAHAPLQMPILPRTALKAEQERRAQEMASRDARAAGFFDDPLSSGDDQLIDEEALRDLVSEIVRAELQGALGERITRNVRKLVRREIHRALTAQELE